MRTVRRRTAGSIGAVVLLLVTSVPAGAAPSLALKCRSAKARAATKKAAALAKALAKNDRAPNPTRLLADVSKAQSRFTRAFGKAEGKGGCVSSGDAAAIEAKVDAFVNDLLDELPSAASTTSTSTTAMPGTTTTTIPVGCGVSSFPTCGGACPVGEVCVPVRFESSCGPPATDTCFCVLAGATCMGTGSCVQDDCEVGLCPQGEVCRAFDGCCSDFCGSECVAP